MSATTTLRRARELIAGGWTPGCWAGLCEDSSGKACEPSAEMVRLFTVEGALAVSASSASELLDAHRALDQVHHPITFAADEMLSSLPRAADGSFDKSRWAGDEVYRWLKLQQAAIKANETDLDTWLRRPHRQLADVLRLIDLAISRATAKEAA